MYTVYTAYTNINKYTMSTDVRKNFNIDKKTYEEAAKIAEELNLSLSAVINQLLRDFAAKKEITFTKYGK